MRSFIVAVDPGREKCGFAVVHTDGRVESKAVLTLPELERAVGALTGVTAYVVGDGTASPQAVDALRRAGVANEAIHHIDEYKSSEIGRRRYWEANPPRGWRRLIPTTMQVPPEPYDDFVAVELARRYIARHAAAGRGSPGKMPNKD